MSNYSEEPIEDVAIEAPFFTEGGKVFCLMPLGNRVLVKRDIEEQSAGGIIIPDQAKETSLTATVIKTGPDCHMVAEGERIFFARFTGKHIDEDLPSEVKQQFHNVMICTEDDIIGHVIEMEVE